MDNDPSTTLNTEKSFSDRRTEIINNHGFTNLHEIGNGYFSEVFVATPKDEEVKSNFGDNVIVKAGKGKDLQQDSKLHDEHEILKDLRDIQLAAGLIPQELYTPSPITYIADENVRAVVMTEAKGKAMKEIETPILVDDALSLVIQESHLFSILEASDSTRRDSYLSMSDFQQASNTFVNLKSGQTPKLQMIDWSLRVSKDELNNSRSNERLRISATLAKLLLSKDGVISFENYYDDRAKGARFAMDVNALVKNAKFESIDPSVKYIILKGLGLLKDFPQGYSTHKEMLSDFLAAAKKVGISENIIPQQLQAQFRGIKPADFAVTTSEQLQLPKVTERPPINQEVNRKVLGMYVDMPVAWRGDNLFVYDENARADRYSGEEIAQFCANCSQSDFDYSRSAIKDNPDEVIRNRVGVGRVLAAEYYLRKVFLPDTNLLPDEDVIFRETVGFAIETLGDKSSKSDLIKLAIKNSVNYWSNNKSKIPEGVNINTQQLTEIDNYFDKLAKEYTK